MVEAKPVTVLGCPVGNLWDIYDNGERQCRMTYHGNALTRVKTVPLGTHVPSSTEIAQAISDLYRA